MKIVQRGTWKEWSRRKNKQHRLLADQFLGGEFARNLMFSEHNIKRNKERYKAASDVSLFVQRMKRRINETGCI